MRKKIMAFVFAAALLVAMAVPLFAGGGTARAQEPDALLLVCTLPTGESFFEIFLPVPPKDSMGSLARFCSEFDGTLTVRPVSL